MLWQSQRSGSLVAYNNTLHIYFFPYAFSCSPTVSRLLLAFASPTGAIIPDSKRTVKSVCLVSFYTQFFFSFFCSLWTDLKLLWNKSISRGKFCRSQQEMSMCVWVRAKFIPIHELGINWRTGDKGRSVMNANWLKGNTGDPSKIKQAINLRGGYFTRLCYIFISPFLNIHHPLYLTIDYFWFVCDLCIRNTPLPPLLQKKQSSQQVFLYVPEMLLMTLLLNICFHRKSRLSCSSCTKLDLKRLSFHFQLWPVPAIAIHKWLTLLTPVFPPCEIREGWSTLSTLCSFEPMPCCAMDWPVLQRLGWCICISRAPLHHHPFGESSQHQCVFLLAVASGLPYLIKKESMVEKKPSNFSAIR